MEKLAQGRISQYKSVKSDEMRIQGFKKEFKLKLNNLVNTQVSQGGTNFNSDIHALTGGHWLKQDKVLIDPRRHILDFYQVSRMILEMGFLTPTASQSQEQQLSDLYTMFKCNKDQNILAENLQSALMMVAGIRDESQEIDNDINN